MDESTKLIDKKEMQWRAFLIGPIMMFHMISYTQSTLIIQQYAYSAIQKEKYPNSVHNKKVYFACESNKTSDIYRTLIKIQQDTSNLILYLSLASFLPAIFTNFLIGCYSDRFGRKTLLIFAFIGQFIKSSLSAVAVYLEWNIYYFVIFYTVEGVTGAQLGPMTIAFSIAADLTTSGKNRSFAIAMVDFSIGLGVVIGNLISGYLLNSLGFGKPLTIAAGIYCFEIILVIIFLMETRKHSEKVHRIPLTQNIKEAFSFYVDPRDGKRWIYNTCSLILIMSLISNIGKLRIDVLYELNAPFCWQSVQIGIYGTVRSIAVSNIGILSIRLFQRCISDESIILLGLISNTLSLIQEGLAPNTTVLYLVSVVAFASMMPIPLTRGIMSKITAPDKQGALFSGSGAVSALCNLIAAVSANGIYTGTVGIYKGLVYFLLAVPSVTAIGLVLLLRIRKNNKKIEKDNTKDVIVDSEPIN